MYVEMLIEDASGKRAMDILLPKLVAGGMPVVTRHYKGVGRIPKGLKPKTDASKRQLLDQLPRLLQGFGKVPDCGAVVVICDLDNNEKHRFLAELDNMLESCNPRPNAVFCLADAVHKGGSKALGEKGWRAVGEQKSLWAETISPHMDVEENASPSFQEMRDRLRGVVL